MWEPLKSRQATFLEFGPTRFPLGSKHSWPTRKGGEGAQRSSHNTSPSPHEPCMFALHSCVGFLAFILSAALSSAAYTYLLSPTQVTPTILSVFGFTHSTYTHRLAYTYSSGRSIHFPPRKRRQKVIPAHKLLLPERISGSLGVVAKQGAERKTLHV